MTVHIDAVRTEYLIVEGEATADPCECWDRENRGIIGSAYLLEDAERIVAAFNAEPIRAEPIRPRVERAHPTTPADVLPVGELDTEPDVVDMLLACLEWLGNVRSQDRQRYLDAMPNNVPGIDAMHERLNEIAGTEV